MNIILNELIMFIKLYIEVKVMRIKMCFGLNKILGIIILNVIMEKVVLLKCYRCILV